MSDHRNSGHPPSITPHWKTNHIIDSVECPNTGLTVGSVTFSYVPGVWQYLSSEVVELTLLAEFCNNPLLTLIS